MGDKKKYKVIYIDFLLWNHYKLCLLFVYFFYIYKRSNLFTGQLIETTDNEDVVNACMHLREHLFL